MWCMGCLRSIPISELIFFCFYLNLSDADISNSDPLKIILTHYHVVGIKQFYIPLCVCVYMRVHVHHYHYWFVCYYHKSFIFLIYFLYCMMLYDSSFFTNKMFSQSCLKSHHISELRFLFFVKIFLMLIYPQPIKLWPIKNCVCVCVCVCVCMYMCVITIIDWTVIITNLLFLFFVLHDLMIIHAWCAYHALWFIMFLPSKCVANLAWNINFCYSHTLLLWSFIVVDHIRMWDWDNVSRNNPSHYLWFFTVSDHIRRWDWDNVSRNNPAHYLWYFTVSDHIRKWDRHGLQE